MKDCRLLVLDFDGVMTNGTKLYDGEGKCVAKSCNDKDFTAIKRFRSIGVPVVVLSGAIEINENICRNRNITFIYADRDKDTFLDHFCTTYNCTANKIAFIGDDLPDLCLLKKVGYPFCPSDAISDVRRIGVTLTRAGGQGCVAELLHFYKRANPTAVENEDMFKNLDRSESW